MFNWLFKKVVNLREKVAVDLGGGDVEKPFLDHLDDLRKMIVRMVTSLLVVTLGTFMFHKELLQTLFMPISFAGLNGKITIQSFEVTGPFMTAMNISLVAGVILAFPVLLFFLLQFVLPGLKNTEKKVLFPAICVGAGLFLTGVLFAYFVVTPRALTFFYEFGTSLTGSAALPDASAAAPAVGPAAPAVYIWELTKYVKFICQFILIFGLCFELPVVVMALVKLDVLNYKVMKTSRAWAAIMIAVIAAVITPTQDALTLGLLAVPMYALYEICIWLAWYMEKQDRKLYPEYYKEQDEETKAVEVADDWDNENYNPWNDGNGDDDSDDGDATTRKPAPASPSPTPSPASSASVLTTENTSLPAVEADGSSAEPIESPREEESAGEGEPKKTEQPKSDGIEPNADKRDTD